MILTAFVLVSVKHLLLFNSLETPLSISNELIKFIHIIGHCSLCFLVIDGLLTESTEANCIFRIVEWHMVDRIFGIVHLSKISIVSSFLDRCLLWFMLLLL